MEIRYDFEGMGCYGGYSPVLKNWVASAIGAAIGLGSTIFGGAQSAKKEREAEAKETAGHNASMAYFKRKYNEYYGDTAAGQNTIRKAIEGADHILRHERGASAVGGGTVAGSADSKERANNMIGNGMANIAGNDTARKDSAGAAMASEEKSYASSQAANLRQQGSNIASVASSAGNAIASGVSGLESDMSTINGAQSDLASNASSTLKNADANVGMSASEKSAFGSDSDADAKKRAKDVFNSWK